MTTFSLGLYILSDSDHADPVNLASFWFLMTFQ